MSESQQKWLARNRPPRVQIEYDVETLGAQQKKELPLVVGIMADLSGKSELKPTAIKDRSFVTIDRDNFEKIFEAIKPTLKFTTKYRKDPDADEEDIGVDLTFESYDELDPGTVARKVFPDLMSRRQRLAELLAKLDGNDRLKGLLDQAQQDGHMDELKKIGEEMRGKLGSSDATNGTATNGA